ncbi:MAG: Pyrrolo-quinoline quinone repeat-containing protein [Edaphobacter sp.]|nr:Pyrrolo-quinoline quinone repeat-containing protein [Edaphobacter sp.]
MSPCSKALAGCISFFSLLLLSSCGGGSSPGPAGDFTLSAAPASLSLVSGGAGQQISVNAIPANGFAGTVNVATVSLPAGVTAQPATLSLSPGIAQTVTLTAGTNAVAGSATVTFTGTSGALSHSATVSAAITAPPPDFTLTLSPASLTLVAGGAGAAASVTAGAVNSFAGTVAVAITGLPAGVTANPATLSLAPGVAQSTTLTAALNATAAISMVTFTGTSSSISHSASLVLTVQAAPMTNAPDVTTYHYNVSRDGLNAKETILTQANVNSTQFGKIGFDAVDGKVDAQPLYLANVAINGQLHNVLYVATEHDSVYAFDADSGTQFWKTSILGSGETTSDDHGCFQITPEIGITSTPVIDRKQGPSGTIFTIGMSKDASGKYHQRLHALDITTGAEISSSPTEITATYPGTGDNTQNGNVVFDPSQYAERAALLLLNGSIYTGWTSHCDIGLYTGWVMAYSESTLQQTQLLNVTPNGHEGSIWMSGGGMAADSNGFIYFLDANGTFDTTFDANGFPSKGDYGNAMLKLSTSGKLAVADYFETFNTTQESAADVDLGSGGPLLLPDQTDANGHVFHLIVGAGKARNIYLADRDNMGKFNFSNMPVDDSNIYQELRGVLGGQVYSTPAYFNGVLYYAADGDTLKAFPLTNAKLATIASSQSAVTFSHPGPTPSISANGTQNGIVWALESGLSNPAVLHAYDPANLSHEFYNSNQAANGRDSFGNGNKFIIPVTVNGKVYVGTQNGVAVFGLLSH